MQYDYYSCPYEPDTGIPPCGEMPECKPVLGVTLQTAKTRTMAAVTQATTAIISSIKFKLFASSIKTACYRMTK